MKQSDDLRQSVVDLTNQVESLKKEISAQDDIIAWLRKELAVLQPEMTMRVATYPGSTLEFPLKDSVFLK